MMKRFFLYLILAVVLCACGTAARYGRGPENSVLEALPGEGIVEAVYYPSSEPHLTQRRMLVYLPKDYYKDTLKRYPVLYLFHGARGNEKTWVDSADVFHRLDSLRHEGLAKDFILVMPNMNRYANDKQFNNGRCLRALEAFWTQTGEPERYFRHDVVGFVDRRYRTIPTKAGRAIAGMSNGGLQAVYLSANNPQTYDYVGLMSPYTQATMAAKYHRDVYKGLAWKLEEQFTIPPKEYVIYIGKTDFFHPHIEFYRKRLTRHGYPHEFVLTEGGHEWYNWIAYYEDFCQRIFQ